MHESFGHELLMHQLRGHEEIRQALADTAQLLCELDYKEGDRERRFAGAAKLLERLDSAMLHWPLPVEAWGVRTIGDNAWQGLRITHCSLVGLMFARSEVENLRFIAERHAIDPTQPALRVAGPAVAQPQTMSGAAHLVASGNASISNWWCGVLQSHPEQRPPAKWDPMPDLRQGMELRKPLEPENRNSSVLVGIGPVLVAASRVDLQWLAGLSTVQPPDNPLLNVLTSVLNTTAVGLGEDADLNHLILGRGADILPRGQQSSLLHVYAGMRNARACLELLEDGHPLNLRDQWNRTAADVARDKDSSIEDLLRSWEARQAAAEALSAALPRPAA